MPDERRLVTVLFADVVGSTSLGESIDPEDLRALLSRFFMVASEVIAVHGGTLEKFIGDAAMAIFGIPQAHDDDARRAMAAGLELRDRIRDDPILGERLPIRLGLNTGEVMASRERSDGNFIVTGDAVNVAARLQQAAEPWQLLVTLRSARAAGSAFAFGPPVELELKGKSGATTVLPVLGVAESSTHRIPLVGREGDLEQLMLVARRAVAERRPYLVSIIAPPGTGKTRLLEEFIDRLPQVAPGALVATAQCLPYGQRLTYAPLRSLLLQIVGQGEESTAEQIREAATVWLREAGDEGPERTADLLTATIGLSDGEVADRGDIFAAWRRTVELCAGRGPLMLVIEDLHWSSESLLDLIEYILQPRTDAPLLMVVLTRPELLDRRPTWGGGRRNYVSLALEPLDSTAVGQLVEYILERPAPELVRLVADRAEGNPFYVGELVRSIRERVASFDDAEALAEAVATLPDTVQATVLARLDLLDPMARRLLQLGSVYGRTFSMAGLQALEPDGLPDLESAADRLLERDLVRPAGRGSYAFRHILIREVAYQTLPRAERARLHANAGRWLASIAAGREDELAELIAFHLREAATLTATSGTRDAGIDTEAVTWLRRAGEAAFAAAANAEASRHLLAAIGLADPSEHPELYARLGDTYLAGDQSVASYATALRIGREQGRPDAFRLRVLAKMLMVMGRWYASVADQPNEAAHNRLRDEARELIPGAADQHAVATFLISEAFFPYWLRNTGQRLASSEEEEAARRSAAQGMAIAEQLGDPSLLSAAFDARGSLTSSTDPAGARRTAQRRLTIPRLGMTERSDAQFVVAWASSIIGDLATVLSATESELAQIQPGQGPGFAIGLAAWRSSAFWQLGRWDRVAASYEAMHNLWIEANRMAAGFALQGMYAAMAVGRGRGDAALQQRAQEMFEDIVSRFEAGHPTRALAVLATVDLPRIASEVVARADLWLLDRPVHVECALALCSDGGQRLSPEVVQPILERAARGSMALTEAQARRSLGLSRAEPAELERALALFEASGSRPFAARVRTELGLLTGEQATLERGLAELEAIGDQEQIGRVNARRGGLPG